MGYCQPDLVDGEYVLWMGTYPGATGKSFQSISKRSFGSLNAGTMKMDVFDPVLANGCVTPTAPNITWHPTKPTTTNALILGMLRWIIENKTYNEEFLSFPTYQAAWEGGYASNTTATHLVITDENHPNYGKLMTPADAGLEEPAAPQAATGAAAAAAATPTEYYVVINAETGEPAVHTTCAHGVVEYEGEVNGVAVRSSFMFLKDSALSRSMDEYAELTDVPVDVIENTAREFTSHGVKASLNGMGNTVQANGLSHIYGFRVLASMVGSNFMVGGSVVKSTGGVAMTNGSRYLLNTVQGKPNVSAKNATYISRTNFDWTATDEYKNRVAAGETDPKPKLPWFSCNSPLDNQALVSIAHQYPYQAKIVISWMVDSIEGTPGAMRDAILDKLKDPSVLPLHIACDVVIGEHAQIADYIVPDTNPFETFGVGTQEGYWCGKGNAVRWPAKKPETMQLPDGRYASYEAFLVDVAKACGVPGFGENAIPAADGTMWPLNDACDFFLKGVANLAFDEDPVDDITEEEVRLQALDELPEAWKAAVTEEEWPKVLNVISRGGRFWPEEISVGPDGKRCAWAKQNTISYYSDKRGATANPLSGKLCSPTFVYEPEMLADCTPTRDVYTEEEWPFLSCNYKPRFRSISMLSNSPIMRDLCAHNYIEINIEDARELGIRDGDQVRVTNPTGDVMEGEAMVRAGVNRRTLGFAYGYGKIAYGAQDVNIEGEEPRPGNPDIGAGVHLQAMLDPTVADAYPVADPEAGTPARSGAAFKIEKI